MTEPDSSGPSGLADSVFFGGKEQKEAEKAERNEVHRPFNQGSSFQNSDFYDVHEVVVVINVLL